MGQEPSQAQRDVEAARERLGETVEAIAYRVNAPRRAKDRLAARFSRLTRRKQSSTSRTGEHDGSRNDRGTGGKANGDGDDAGA